MPFLHDSSEMQGEGGDGLDELDLSTATLHFRLSPSKLTVCVSLACARQIEEHSCLDTQDGPGTVYEASAH